MISTNSVGDVGGDIPFEELVQALRDGEDDAWALAFDRLQQTITPFVRGLFGAEIGKADERDEAAASACGSLIRRIKCGEFEPRGWEDLALLFSHLVTNKWRAQHRKKRPLNLTDVRPVAGAHEPNDAHEPASPDPTPAEETIRSETLREFGRIRDLLRRRLHRGRKGQFYQIFKLKLDGKHTNREIATIIGCSETIVKQAWKYTRDLLKGLLDGQSWVE